MARSHAIVTTLLLCAAPAAASPSPPPPDSALSAELVDLRLQLVRTSKAEAQAQQAKFRPLCDKDGYPLVGNLANKSDRYQPSAFCADLRKRRA